MTEREADMKLIADIAAAPDVPPAEWKTEIRQIEGVAVSIGYRFQWPHHMYRVEVERRKMFVQDRPGEVYHCSHEDSATFYNEDRDIAHARALAWAKNIARLRMIERVAEAAITGPVDITIAANDLEPLQTIAEYAGRAGQVWDDECIVDLTEHCRAYPDCGIPIGGIAYVEPDDQKIEVNIVQVYRIGERIIAVYSARNL